MKNVLCTTISVDCVKNDPVDVRCGGPAYLGFDFHVNKKNDVMMREFIINTLQGYEIPIEAIYSHGEFYLPSDQVWTDKKIVEEIEKEVDYLKSEAAINQHFRY